MTENWVGVWNNPVSHRTRAEQKLGLIYFISIDFFSYRHMAMNRKMCETFQRRRSKIDSFDLSRVTGKLLFSRFRSLVAEMVPRRLWVGG